MPSGSYSLRRPLSSAPLWCQVGKWRLQSPPLLTACIVGTQQTCRYHLHAFANTCFFIPCRRKVRSRVGNGRIRGSKHQGRKCADFALEFLSTFFTSKEISKHPRLISTHPHSRLKPRNTHKKNMVLIISGRERPRRKETRFENELGNISG